MYIYIYIYCTWNKSRFTINHIILSCYHLVQPIVSSYNLLHNQQLRQNYYLSPVMQEMNSLSLLLEKNTQTIQFSTSIKVGHQLEPDKTNIWKTNSQQGYPDIKSVVRFKLQKHWALCFPQCNSIAPFDKSSLPGQCLCLSVILNWFLKPEPRYLVNIN